MQESRPTGTIPLAGNKVIRHPDESKQPSYKFEIVGEQCAQCAELRSHVSLGDPFI